MSVVFDWEKHSLPTEAPFRISELPYRWEVIDNKVIHAGSGLCLPNLPEVYGDFAFTGLFWFRNRHVAMNCMLSPTPTDGADLDNMEWPAPPPEVLGIETLTGGEVERFERTFHSANESYNMFNGASFFQFRSKYREWFLPYPKRPREGWVEKAPVWGTAWRYADGKFVLRG